MFITHAPIVTPNAPLSSQSSTCDCSNGVACKDLAASQLRVTAAASSESSTW